MIQRVPDPQPKRRLGEKHILLSERIQLRIPIQHPRRHELVKHPDHERWEDGEDDIVKRDRPGFIGDLPREVVEKGILLSLSVSRNQTSISGRGARTQNCVM